MHPNFNAMRPNMPPPRMPPQMMSPLFPPNMQNLQNNVNQFNQRLVQEIQQNHPMLPFNRMNNNFNNGMINMQQHHMNANMHHMNGGKHMQQQNFRANGNLVSLHIPQIFSIDLTEFVFRMTTTTIMRT